VTAGTSPAERFGAIVQGFAGDRDGLR
jgi:hypothetical protein